MVYTIMPHENYSWNKSTYQKIRSKNQWKSICEKELKIKWKINNRNLFYFNFINWEGEKIENI